MDENIKNKVDQLLKNFEQEDLQVSQSDPIAKMMLVALAHQAYQIERKIDNSLSRLSDLFSQRIFTQNLLKPQPALSLIQIKNGSQYAPYRVDEKTTFTLKGEKKHYRPLFPVQIIPGRLVCLVAEKKLIFDGQPAVSLVAPAPAHEIWIAYQAADEVKTLAGFSLMMNAPLLYGAKIRAEVNGIPVPIHPVFEQKAFALQTDFETVESWKQLLIRQERWLYCFGDYQSEKNVLPSRTPAWLSNCIDAESAAILGNQRFIWIKLTSDSGCRLPDQPELRFNCLPIANYDIAHTKLSDAEPLQCLDNPKNNAQYLDVIREPETINYFFIRDFDVNQYDNHRIRDDIATLYRHFTDDYFAFIAQNSLQNSDRLTGLQKAIDSINDTVENSFRLATKPFSGTYAIRNPHLCPESLVITYLTTNGETGNNLKAGQLIRASFTGCGEIEVLTDAEGGRDKSAGVTAHQTCAQSYVLSHERLFTPIDFQLYIRKELVRFFGEEIVHHTQIEISTGDIPGKRHIEKCIHIHLSFEQAKAFEKARQSHFREYLETQLAMRSATLYKLKVQIHQL